MEAGVPTLPRHAPPARRAAAPDSAQRALRPMSRRAGYPASGPQRKSIIEGEDEYNACIAALKTWNTRYIDRREA